MHPFHQLCFTFKWKEALDYLNSKDVCKTEKYQALNCLIDEKEIESLIYGLGGGNMTDKFKLLQEIARIKIKGSNCEDLIVKNEDVSITMDIVSVRHQVKALAESGDNEDESNSGENLDQGTQLGNIVETIADLGLVTSDEPGNLGQHEEVTAKSNIGAKGAFQEMHLQLENSPDRILDTRSQADNIEDLELLLDFLGKEKDARKHAKPQMLDAVAKGMKVSSSFKSIHNGKEIGELKIQAMSVWSEGYAGVVADHGDGTGTILFSKISPCDFKFNMELLEWDDADESCFVEVDLKISLKHHEVAACGEGGEQATTLLTLPREYFTYDDNSKQWKRNLMEEGYPKIVETDDGKNQIVTFRFQNITGRIFYDPTFKTFKTVALAFATLFLGHNSEAFVPGRSAPLYNIRSSNYPPRHAQIGNPRATPSTGSNSAMFMLHDHNILADLISHIPASLQNTPPSVQNTPPSQGIHPEDLSSLLRKFSKDPSGLSLHEYEEGLVRLGNIYNGFVGAGQIANIPYLGGKKLGDLCLEKNEKDLSRNEVDSGSNTHTTHTSNEINTIISEKDSKDKKFDELKEKKSKLLKKRRELNSQQIKKVREKIRAMKKNSFADTNGIEDLETYQGEIDKINNEIKDVDGEIGSIKTLIKGIKHVRLEETDLKLEKKKKQSKIDELKEKKSDLFKEKGERLSQKSDLLNEKMNVSFKIRAMKKNSSADTDWIDRLDTNFDGFLESWVEQIQYGVEEIEIEIKEVEDGIEEIKIEIEEIKIEIKEIERKRVISTGPKAIEDNKANGLDDTGSNTQITDASEANPAERKSDISTRRAAELAKLKKEKRQCENEAAKIDLHIWKMEDKGVDTVRIKKRKEHLETKNNQIEEIRGQISEIEGTEIEETN